MSADILGARGRENGGRHFRARALSTCPSGRVCQRYGSDEPRPTWRCRPLPIFITISIPPSPRRFSAPHSQPSNPNTKLITLFIFTALACILAFPPHFAPKHAGYSPSFRQIVAGTAGSTNSRRSRARHATRSLGRCLPLPLSLNYTEPGKRRRRRARFDDRHSVPKPFSVRCSDNA